MQEIAMWIFPIIHGIGYNFSTEWTNSHQLKAIKTDCKLAWNIQFFRRAADFIMINMNWLPVKYAP